MMSRNEELNIYALLFAVEISELSNIDVSSTAFHEAVDLIIMYSWFSRGGTFFVFAFFLSLFPGRMLFALHHIDRFMRVRVQSNYTHRTWAILMCVHIIFVFVLPLRRWSMKMHVSMKIKNPLSLYFSLLLHPFTHVIFFLFFVTMPFSVNTLYSVQEFFKKQLL